jgi:flagellar hook assembly protein FlgD
LLASVWPNPSGNNVPITLLVTDKKALHVAVYSIDGRLIRSLNTRGVMYGVNTLKWDGRDERGNSVPAGTYLVKASSKSRSQTQRVVLVR